MKTFWCKFGCRTLLTYDFGVIGKNGRGIPTLYNGVVHECPYHPHRLSRRTNYEETVIDITKQVVAHNGSRLTRHRMILLVEPIAEAETI